MKPLITALLALLIFTTACRKERTSYDTSQKHPPVRLKEIIVSSATVKNQYQLSYDAAGNVSGYLLNNATNGEDWRTERRVTFERDAENRIVKEKSLAGQYSGFERIYSYKSGNELARKVFYYKSAGPEPYFYYDYQWENGKIMAAFMYTADEYINAETFTYDANGNVKRHVGSDYAWSRSRVVKSENARYDDKPNYMNMVTGLDAVYIFGMDAQALSRNNMVYNEYEVSGGMVTETYELSYNKYGYVAKEVLNGGERVREFTYEEIK